MPVRAALNAMGISINDINCPMCGRNEETIDHALFTCEKAKAVWDKFSNWWRLPVINGSSIEEVWEWSYKATIQRGGKKGVQLGIAAVMKCLWEARNEKVFKDSYPNEDRMFKDIQESSFLWMSSRNRRIKGDFLAWIDNPYEVF